MALLSEIPDDLIALIRESKTLTDYQQRWYTWEPKPWTEGNTFTQTAVDKLEWVRKERENLEPWHKDLDDLYRYIQAVEGQLGAELGTQMAKRVQEIESRLTETNAAIKILITGFEEFGKKVDQQLADMAERIEQFNPEFGRF